MTIRRVISSLVPAVALAVTVLGVASAQTGKWVATVPQLTIRGAADITVEPRNEKQSKVKVVLRNAPNDRQVAWDIVAGRCGEEGLPIAPQATFRQIRTGLDGQGEATANVPALVPGKQYYIRIFDPGTMPSDRGGFGCANFSEKP